MYAQPTPWSPSVTIRRDIHRNRYGLMWDVAQVTGKAIAYGRKYTGNIRNGEVGALAWFFANGLRNLENRWNSTLDDTQVSLKGVFCHKSGNAGPVVDFHHALGGCELADILLILTQAGTSSGTARGNALFLQAKDHRWPLTGNSTTKQKFIAGGGGGVVAAAWSAWRGGGVVGAGGGVGGGVGVGGGSRWRRRVGGGVGGDVVVTVRNA